MSACVSSLVLAKIFWRYTVTLHQDIHLIECTHRITRDISSASTSNSLVAITFIPALMKAQGSQKQPLSAVGFYVLKF